ncbi:MAG: hypothetical protein KBT12_03440 [Bacteroidales bacterium]|nr:hypothetical protein [Candidatus Physcousia equi]
MKKFFMIAVAAVSMTLASCGGSVESKVNGYMDDLSEAIAKKDLGKMMSIATDMQEWEKGLSEEDKKAAEAAAEAWAKNNPEKAASMGGL